MASRLQEFLGNVKAARDERAADQKALITRLKRLTADEFVRVPLEDLQDLSMAQYEEVSQHIVPDHKLPQPPAEPPKPPQRRLRNLWKATPDWLQAFVAAMVAGLPILMAALLVVPALHWWQYQTPPVRSIDASTWPPCSRLNEWVDGCTYVPHSALTWPSTASLLGIPEEELRETNRHIRENYIPAGAMIVVWRHRGTLQGGNP